MAAVPAKILLKSQTKISLNERFSKLPTPASTETVRTLAAQETQASARNRRLALQMENRPAVKAALGSGEPQQVSFAQPALAQPRVNAPGQSRLMPPVQQQQQQQRMSPQRQPIQQRLPVHQRLPVQQRITPRPIPVQQRLGKGSAKSRLSLPQRGGFVQQRGRGVVQQRGRGARGGFSLNNRRGGVVGARGGFNNRGRGGFNTRGNRGNNRFAHGRGGGAVSSTLDKFDYSGSASLGVPGSSHVGGFLRGRGGFNTRGNRGNNRFARGRGRGGGRGGGAVSASTLDNQLDEYMSKTKNSLDAELDAYMAETQD